MDWTESVARSIQRASRLVRLSVSRYTGPAPAKFFTGVTDVCDVTLADLNGNGGFNPVDLTFASNRLCVNPTPSGGTLDSWQVAQNHASFLLNVSDFEVRYAMPGDAPGTWNRNPGMVNVGKQYVAAPDSNTTATGGDLTRIAWPSMIRIRWRMHDSQARIGQGPESGRWYEQIIRVKRD